MHKKSLSDKISKYCSCFSQNWMKMCYHIYFLEKIVILVKNSVKFGSQELAVVIDELKGPLMGLTKQSLNPNTIKSYKNCLQNMQHMVLHNRPTLSIGTERLACLNSPPGVQLGILA